MSSTQIFMMLYFFRLRAATTFSGVACCVETTESAIGGGMIVVLLNVSSSLPSEEYVYLREEGAVDLEVAVSNLKPLSTEPFVEAVESDQQ